MRRTGRSRADVGQSSESPPRYQAIGLLPYGCCYLLAALHTVLRPDRNLHFKAAECCLRVPPSFKQTSHMARSVITTPGRRR